MSSEVEFVARKEFKYDGEVIHKGDAWVPSGGKFDDLIIANQDKVVPVDDRFNDRKRKRRGKNAKNGTQKAGPIVKDRDAEAYRLYHEEGMTMEEVGEALSVAASTVSRALKRYEERVESEQ